MARQARHTEPIATSFGILTNYDEIERLLTAGEVRGRTWVFQQAQATIQHQRLPTDIEILALHKEMFGHLFTWAGQTRKVDAGPGMKVPVQWPYVSTQLRELTLNAPYWLTSENPTLSDVASFIARFHHRFQYIHPFQDTNGRTGRVLDHYLLWITFGLFGADLINSPMIEYFPSEREENAYYDGLNAADAGDPSRLTKYYISRLDALFSTSSASP